MRPPANAIDSDVSTAGCWRSQPWLVAVNADVSGTSVVSTSSRDKSHWLSGGQFPVFFVIADMNFMAVRQLGMVGLVTPVFTSEKFCPAFRMAEKPSLE
jgi:hypothetical protein